MKCAEILQLICEQRLIEVFLNITTALNNAYHKLGIGNVFFKEFLYKEQISGNYVWRVLKFFILPLENDIIRKISYEKTVCEYVEKEYFVKCDSYMYYHMCRIKIYWVWSLLCFLLLFYDTS